MDYKIVWSIVLALIIWKALENIIDEVAVSLNRYISNKRFIKAMEKLEDEYAFQYDICGDDCEICSDSQGTISVAKKKPVKKTVAKKKPAKRR